MREKITTQFVCQSISQSFCHTDLEDGSLLKIETSIKMLHQDILSPFNVLEFLVLIFTPVILGHTIVSK